MSKDDHTDKNHHELARAEKFGQMASDISAIRERIGDITSILNRHDNRIAATERMVWIGLGLLTAANLLAPVIENWITK